MLTTVSCGSNFHLIKTFTLPTPTGTISLYTYKLYLLFGTQASASFSASFRLGARFHRSHLPHP